MPALPAITPKSSNLRVFTRGQACWRALLFGVIAAAGLISGCTGPGEWIQNGFKVGPNYQKPPAPVASEWIDSRSPGVNVTSGELCNWWTVFRDPVLNGLVD